MSIFSKISSQGRVDFAKNLSVMLRGGISINEILQSLAEQAKYKPFRKVVTRIHNDVEAGVSLSEAFDRERDVFGSVFISLIKAGEASGTLEENLAFAADWLERNNVLKSEIKSATLYPKVVIAATFLLGGTLSIYILPQLMPLFNQLRVDLPLATRILLAFTKFIDKFWPLVALGIASSIVGFIFLEKLRIVKRFLHLLYIKAPFVGALMINYQLALVSQLLATLLRSGLSIGESLIITSEAATNVYYQKSIRKIKDMVNKGTMLSESMKEYPALYPINLINIIATGEKSGSLDESFVYLSEFYAKEVKSRTKRLPTIVEPILLVLIAFAVGFVALSIIMPIYQLTRVISQ